MVMSLQLANFIFTKAVPHKILLVDFDWGGEAGRVYFPPGQLNEELGVDDDRLTGRSPWGMTGRCSRGRLNSWTDSLLRRHLLVGLRWM